MGGICTRQEGDELYLHFSIKISRNVGKSKEVSELN
jgi:hypothetical protein